MEGRVKIWSCWNGKQKLQLPCTNELPPLAEIWFTNQNGQFDRLYSISNMAWEQPGILQEELEIVAGESGVWYILLSLLSPQSNPG